MLPDSAAGKQGKCPACEAEFPVVAASGPATWAQQPAEQEQRDASLVRCPTCERTLAFEPSLAGQAIICPTCQSRLRMPSTPGQVADPATGPTFAQGPDPSSPWSDWTSPQPPAAPPGSENPYSPVAGPAVPQNSYLTPAIVLVMFAAPSVLVMSLGFFGGALELLMGGDLLEGMARIGLISLALAINIATLLGGIAMIRRRNLTLAKLGAVAAMLPCTACFVPQLPFAIWALVVLNRAAAQRDFNRTPGGSPERLP